MPTSSAYIARIHRLDGSVKGEGKGAERRRDEPPGQPRLVSRQTKHLAGRVGAIEFLGAWTSIDQRLVRLFGPGSQEFHASVSDSLDENVWPEPAGLSASVSSGDFSASGER